MLTLKVTLRRIGGLIFGNFRWKLLSLIIAVGLWYYANSRQQQETYLTVPLSVKLEGDYALLYQSVERVSMRVKGPRSLVSDLEEGREQLRLLCNMGSQSLEERDRHRLTIDPAWLTLPQRERVQLRFDDISPEQLELHTSPYGKRRLPVKVQLLGEPREGYRIDREAISVVPSEVVVRAPEAVLEGMTAVRTKDIPVYDRDFTDRVQLADTSVIELEEGKEIRWELDLSPATVTVRIRLTLVPRERTFEIGKPALLQPANFPYAVEISAEEENFQVTVSALPQILEGLTPEQFRAYVDVADLAGEGIEPGTSAPYRQEVELILPPGLSPDAVTVQPRQITIILTNLVGGLQ